nr:hypothetical protein [uncultured Prevotella sp.]
MSFISTWMNVTTAQLMITTCTQTDLQNLAKWRISLSVTVKYCFTSVVAAGWTKMGRVYCLTPVPFVQKVHVYPQGWRLF